MIRIFFWMMGFGLAVSGGISTIAYLNIMTAGKNFMEYLVYISDKTECYLLPIGLAIISLSIFFPEKKNIN
nr:hypothetical protein [Neobacillus terrae]